VNIGVLRRDGRTDPFFDGAAAGRLVIKRCPSCDAWFAPDASGCPGCGEEDLGWAEARGAATQVTWTIQPKDPPALVTAATTSRQ
jgi:uncharacterized OB-fold protein